MDSEVKKVTDSDYLNLSNLAYLPFVKEDTGNALSDIFNNSERAEKLMDSNLDGKVSEDERLIWNTKNSYFGKEFLDTWEVLAVEDQNSEGSGIGFFGVAFKNKNTGEVVFSFRGTEGDNNKEIPKDMLLADLQIVMGVIPQQYEAAKLFYDRIIDNNMFNFNRDNVSVVGHSLGGGIAQYVATMGAQEPAKLRTFNGVGVATHKLINKNDFMGYEGGLVNLIKDLESYKEKIQEQLWNKLTEAQKALLTVMDYNVESIKNSNAFKSLTFLVFLFKDSILEAIGDKLNFDLVTALEEIYPAIEGLYSIAEEEIGIADKIIGKLKADNLINSYAGDSNTYELNTLEFKKISNIDDYFHDLYVNGYFSDGRNTLSRAEEKTDAFINSSAFQKIMSVLGQEQSENIKKLYDDSMGYDNSFLDNMTNYPGEDDFKIKYFQMIKEKFIRTAEFSMNFSERSNQDDYKNYVHSKDMTGTIFKHLGKTYLLDQNLEEGDNISYNTYMEAIKGDNSFLLKLLSTTIPLLYDESSKDIVKYHQYNVLSAFNDSETGETSPKIHSGYIKAIISKLLDDGKLDEKVINNFYKSIAVSNPNGDVNSLKSEILSVLNNAKNKDYFEQREMVLLSEVIDSLNNFEYNFKELLCLSQIVDNNSENYELKDNINLKDEVSYFDTFFVTKENIIQSKITKNLDLIGTNFVETHADKYLQKGLITQGSTIMGVKEVFTPQEVKDYESKNNIVFGNEKNNRIKTSDADNRIFAGGGNDFVFGGKGEDIIYGGAGNDSLVGGVTASWDKDKFSDRLIGGEGDDKLLGGSGVDEYVFDLSEDSGNDLIVDTDKRGIIKIKNGNDFIEVCGTLAADGSILKGLTKMEGITWEKGKYDKNTGNYNELGTSITIVYKNKQNITNRITIENFVKQYTIGGGEWLYQEEILGLKFPSLMTGDNEVHNTIMETFLSTPELDNVGSFLSPIIRFPDMAIGFMIAMGTQTVINIKNKACQSDPLILDLDGDGVETSAMAEGTYFDLNGDGSKEKAGWVGQDDGLLVYDRNSDGVIDSGRELFGDATRLRDGRIAQTGFEALSEFDSNSDGIIDKNDREFKKLKVWQDINSDGISQTEEIKTLEDLGIESINLASETVNKEVNGNIEVRTSKYTKENKDTGIVAEYLFANDIFDYSNTSNIVISEETKNLLNVSGSGLVLGLQEAMELNIN